MGDRVWHLVVVVAGLPMGLLVLTSSSLVPSDYITPVILAIVPLLVLCMVHWVAVQLFLHN